MGQDIPMIFLVKTYLATIAAAALFVGVMLLPAALLVLIHEAAQRLRALSSEWTLTQSAQTSTAPVAPSRH